MILQAHDWSIRMIASNPAMHPATRPLHFPGNLTLLPALQMQCNGSLAKLDLRLHRYTSSVSPEGVTYVLAVLFVRPVTDLLTLLLLQISCQSTARVTRWWTGRG